MKISEQRPPKKKELRLALVCYGGVSLAVYMHGITKEFWKLLKASRAHAEPKNGTVPASVSVWEDLLRSISNDVGLRVVNDVLAGASAGGINAVFLARAITSGHDLDPLTDMWLENADIEHLLDPDSHRPPITRRIFEFYKEPVAWYVSRIVNLSSVDDDEVRTSISKKLTHFVRARWFKPPFSGDRFTRMLADAADAMEDGHRGPALVPPTLGIDLFLTATDYHGVTNRLPIHSPPFVSEKEYRQLFWFRSFAAGPGDGYAEIGSMPELVFAARASASFPGAFPPATVGEIDRMMSKRGRKWHSRDRFLKSQLVGDRAPEKIALIDGSVLANAPFAPAIHAIGRRPVNREVDRRFVYIDPGPGISAVEENEDSRPGFFKTIYRALAEIPRTQPIQESLQEIARVSAHVRRIGSIIEHVTPAVEREILRAAGDISFEHATTPAILAKTRASVQVLAAREAGFAYTAYSQLKIRGVIDEAADILSEAVDADIPTRHLMHAHLNTTAENMGIFDDSTGAGDRNSPPVRILRGLDINYHIRRLRFLLRELRDSINKVAQTHAQLMAANDLKSALYRALGPIQQVRFVCPKHSGLRHAAKAIIRSPECPQKAVEAALDTLATALNLSATDERTDSVLASVANSTVLEPSIRKRLIRAWVGFPFYDTAIYPVMQETHADTFDELKVDRISPNDARTLCEGGTKACLKGWQMNAFAGFFSRSYRENDYLWGRLHAAERLLDILSSSVAEETTIDLAYWRKRLFTSILDEEEGRLTEIHPLFESLRAKIAMLE